MGSKTRYIDQLKFFETVFELLFFHSVEKLLFDDRKIFMLQVTLKNNLISATVSFVAGITLTLTGCAESSALRTEIQKVAFGTKTTLNDRHSIQKTSNTSTSKTEMVGLLGWFEEACGMTANAQSANTPEGQRKRVYNAFTNSFIASRLNNEHLKVALVNPNYQLPSQYRPAIQNISVAQDRPGADIHYYVDFKNATYRGHNLKRLEVFNRPESDYDYQKLYFKDANFTQLKPVFKRIEDELNPGGFIEGEFDNSERSIMCYLGV